MSKHWKPGKKTVELRPAARPSRIRRDPVPAEQTNQINAWWDSREWEIRLAIAGILFFTIAINALVFDIGEFLSR